MKNLYPICFLLKTSAQHSDLISDSSEQWICAIKKPKPEGVTLLLVFIPLSSQGMLGCCVLLNFMHLEKLFMK